MNLLGANYRTSLSGLVETGCLVIIGLCALPTETWQNPKVWIPASGLIIAKTIKDFVTKDKAVTGGTTQQDAKGATVPKHKAKLVEITENVTPK